MGDRERPNGGEQGRIELAVRGSPAARSVQILGEHTFRLLAGTTWPTDNRRYRGGEFGLWAAVQDKDVVGTTGPTSWDKDTECWFWAGFLPPNTFVALPAWISSVAGPPYNWERMDTQSTYASSPAVWVNGAWQYADPNIQSGVGAPKLHDEWSALSTTSHPVGSPFFEVYYGKARVPGGPCHANGRSVARVYYVGVQALWFRTVENGAVLNVDDVTEQFLVFQRGDQ